jgi:hypothetical protein
MAYAAAVTVAVEVISGRRHYLVTIAETEAAAASEFTVPNLPQRGKIMSYKAKRTAGTGTTVDPIIGRSATPTTATLDAIWENGTAAGNIDSFPGVQYYSSTGTIYGRSTPNNAAADHTITTQILIVEGWH